MKHARRQAIMAILAWVVAIAPSRSEAQVYQWTDRDGVVYYTTDRDRIPLDFRDSARVLQSTPRDPDAPDAPMPGTLWFTSGAPILADVHLNGVPLKLVVDTGASRTVISPAAVLRAGIDMRQARRIRIRGVTGAAEAVEVVVPRLDAAGAQIGPLPIVVHEIATSDADGLLGRDVLDGFVLTIDAARGRAILTR